MTLPERAGSHLSAERERKRAARIYKSLNRIKADGCPLAQLELQNVSEIKKESTMVRVMVTPKLIREWPLSDDEEVEVQSSSELWDFLSARKHPKQRPIVQRNIDQITDSILNDGFVKGLNTPIQVCGEHVINWQHRIEVFRKEDPEIRVRLIFGVPLSAMSKCEEPWRRQDIATMALNEKLAKDERIDSIDRAVATMCETIVSGPPPRTTEAVISCSNRWLPEVRIARGLKGGTKNHKKAFRVTAFKACLSLVMSRYGERGDQMVQAVLKEEDCDAVTGLFALHERWITEAKGQAGHRRFGIACLNGFDSWSKGQKGRGPKVWKVSPVKSADSSDKSTASDWNKWKLSQTANGKKR
jgi:hypothetical protein